MPRAAGQLALPFGHGMHFTRAQFVAAPSNADALALVDSWPKWTVGAAAIYGPKGSGKSHLAAIWQSRTQARSVTAQDLSAAAFPDGPAIIDDADASAGDLTRAIGLFHAMERANSAMPLLLTGSTLPSQWISALPDLTSRLAALASVGIGAPDEILLAGVARKLFAERQLVVPEAVIQRILSSIERSHAALVAFVDAVDAASLAENRPVSLAIVRELLNRRENEVS